MENRGEVEYSSILSVKSNVKKNLSMGTFLSRGSVLPQPTPTKNAILQPLSIHLEQ